MTRTPILVSPENAAAIRAAIAEARATGENIMLRSSERAGHNIKLTIDHQHSINLQEILSLEAKVNATTDEILKMDNN
jgi:hypothetical protein